MDKNFVLSAVENHKNGFSCSESIVKAATDSGLIDENSAAVLMNAATPFSGGMGAGCLCGAVSGAQIVIGAMCAKNENQPVIQPLQSNIQNKNAKILAKQFIEEFMKNHRATCCRILSKGFEKGSVEHRENCTNLVYDSAEILDKILQSEFSKV